MEDPLLLPMTISILAILFSLPIVWHFLRLSRKTTSGPPEPSGSWPLIGHLPLLAGTQPLHLTLGNLADKYGPIFTIKIGVHRTLVISNSKLAQECLSTNDKAFATRPKSLTTEILGYNQTITGFSPYGPYWRQTRKILTLKLLSGYQLERLRPVRESEVADAIHGLHKKWVKNKDPVNHKVLVDLKGFFYTITMNNIMNIIVGRRYEEYEKSDTEEDQKGGSRSWRDTFREYMDLSAKVSASDALPYLRFLDFGGIERAMKRVVEELDHVVKGRLDEHKVKGKLASNSMKLGEAESSDFMDLSLSVLDDHKQEFSDRNTDTINKSTCLTMVLAGSDTTAVTLTWTLSLILNSPDALKKVQDELDIRVGRERKVEEPDIKNLEYLQAIVKESLRLYPATPLSLPHESMEDCTVDGFHVPAGTRLFVNLSKIHRDPSVWENPDEFRPERFLTTHKHVDVKGRSFELLPFGSGRRMCPGITSALQFLHLTLANFLHGFEIESPYGTAVDMTESPGLTNMKSSPLDVLLKPRLPAHLY